VITDNVQLSASLRYMASFADSLEGMRRHALESQDAALFPVLAAGPVDQIRQVLAEARAYVDAFPDVAANEGRIAAEREGVAGFPSGNGHEAAPLAVAENAAATEKATGHIV